MVPARHLLARIHRLAALAWAALAAGAGLGFVARDLVAVPQPYVALAWVAGALLGAAPAARITRGGRR